MKKLLSIYMIVAILFVGCDDYLDVNKDPNNPTAVGPELILPTAQNYTARWIQIDRSVNHLGNMFMYNWSEAAGFSWYNSEFQYQANVSTFYSQIFDQAYSSALKQYQDLVNLDGEEFLAYQAIGKIMKAYTFQVLVDFYGDLPYSEALQRSNNATPKYDDAQSIYDDLIVQLTEAIELINQAEASAVALIPGDDDAMYHGDMTAWKQFANTVKLRILTREANVKGNAYVSQELAVIAAEGSGYISSDAEVNPGYSNQQDKQNPFWEDLGWQVSGSQTLSNDATCASDYIIDYLNQTGDARIDRLFEKPATGHKGVPQGINASAADYDPDLVSNIGPGLLRSADQGARILAAAEVHFNLAELALAGYAVGDAETHYNMGVQTSFSSLGAGDASAYLAQPIANVSYADSPNKLEAIITQKWIAVMGITAEQSWFDWSRTGYPAGLPVSIEIPNLQRPYRLSYPASEVGGNTANLPSQPNVFTTKIFWGN